MTDSYKSRGRRQAKQGGGGPATALAARGGRRDAPPSTVRPGGKGAVGAKWRLGGKRAPEATGDSAGRRVASAAGRDSGRGGAGSTRRRGGKEAAAAAGIGVGGGVARKSAFTPSQTRHYVIGLLDRYGLSVRKALGQRFMVDDRVLEDIVAACEMTPQTLVIEVGAGIGNLTTRLAEKAGKVIALELDESFRPLHEKIASAYPNIAFHYGDAMDWDWDKAPGTEFRVPSSESKEQGSEIADCGLQIADSKSEAEDQSSIVNRQSSISNPQSPIPNPQSAIRNPQLLTPDPRPPTPDVVIAGNIPYQISTPLILRLLETPWEWRSVVFTLQREVAERVCAPPGSKTHGSLSLKAQLIGEARILRLIGPECFYPAPQVESAALRLTWRHPPIIADARLRLRFFQLCDGLFAFRRKQAPNSLAKAGTFGLNHDQWTEALRQCGVDPLRRGETLSLEEALQLFHHAIQKP
ncbi:MAG: rRNA adenine dimethyltransferase family protein [Candidatus Sumerlaeota bacterium]|nr:rRNA adenine dimethyltransferase family protein [Candidatus Sumerlaeota bacterium]